MADGTLIITDGTERTNMLGMYRVKSGIQLEKWSPGRLQMKRGGTWNDSPIADFRTITDHRWATIVDTFTYKMIGGCTDDVAYYSQEFDRLLIKGIQYWEQPSNNSPVWIEKRASKESNTSYAIVHGFKLPNDNNPFGQPLTTFVRSFQTKMTIAIEHGPWLDHKPFEYNDTPAGAVMCNNYLYNPSYEDWAAGVPNSWSNLNSATIVENEDLDYVRSGLKSCGFNNSSGAHRGVISTLLGNSETYYIVEVDVYVVSGRAILAMYQVGETPDDGTMDSSSGTGWQTLRVGQVGYPSGGAMTVMIGTHTDTGGEVYFDDISACRYYGSADWYVEKAMPTESADDAYVRCGYYDPVLDCTYNVISTTFQFLFAGAESIPEGAKGYNCGIRFRDVDVPQGAIIRHAIMRFKYDAWSGDHSSGATILIVGEDNATPAIFSTAGDFNSRTHTDHSVEWNVVPDFADDQIINSPDISSIVQEIVNRSDWVSGNNMAMYLLNRCSFWNQILMLSSWDSSDTGPELYIVYSLVAPADEKPMDDATDPFFVANKSNLANLTHIYLYSNPTWSDNMMDEIGSWNIHGGAANDYTLFGISTSAPNNGPFNSLVFNLIDYSDDTVGVNDLLWQYWDGAAWTDIDATTAIMDHTDDGTNGPFSNTNLGVLSVHWEPPDDWATKSENGVTAWWVRLLVNTVSGVYIPHLAEQHADDIVYSVTWPFVEVKDDHIGGDINALAELIFTNKSDGATPTSNEAAYQRLVMGLRDFTRGEDFNAYINASDVQQPNHITTAVDGVDTVWTAHNNSPTGRIAVYSHVGASALADALTITIDGKHAWQYFGTYRVYMRVRLDISGAQVYNNLIITPGPEVRVDTIGTEALVDYAIVDFGLLSIPGRSHVSSDVVEDLTITLQLGCAGTVTHYRIFDLIFIPADQAIYDFLAPTSTQTLGNYSVWTQLDVDSVRNPKRTIRSVRQKQSNNAIIDSWIHSSNRPLMLKPNRDQRLWVLGWTADVTAPVSANINGCGTAEMRHIQRYTGMRGNR